MALYAAAASLRSLVLVAPNIIQTVGTSLLTTSGAAATASGSGRSSGPMPALSTAGGRRHRAAGAAWRAGGSWRSFGASFDEGYPVLLILLASAVAEALALSAYQLLQSQAKLWLSLVATAVPQYGTVVLLAFLLTAASRGGRPGSGRRRRVDSEHGGDVPAGVAPVAVRHRGLFLLTGEGVDVNYVRELTASPVHSGFPAARAPERAIVVQALFLHHRTVALSAETEGGAWSGPPRGRTAVVCRARRLVSIVWTAALFGASGFAAIPADAAPSVVLTSPMAGETLADPVVVSATASADAVGVQFYMDDVELGPEILPGPYAMTWNPWTVSTGNYRLKAVARDAAGNATHSNQALVTAFATPEPGSVFATKALPVVRDRLGRLPGDYVWAGNPSSTVVNTGYLAYDRDPLSVHDLHWFQTYHPDWLVYKCDRVTPIRYFADPLLVYDVTNPAVRSIRIASTYASRSSAGFTASRSTTSFSRTSSASAACTMRAECGSRSTAVSSTIPSTSRTPSRGSPGWPTGSGQREGWSPSI